MGIHVRYGQLLQKGSKFSSARSFKLGWISDPVPTHPKMSFHVIIEAKILKKMAESPLSSISSLSVYTCVLSCQYDSEGKEVPVLLC